VIEISMEAIGKSIEPKLATVATFGFRDAISEEQDAISWRKRDRGCVVVHPRQQAERRTALAGLICQYFDVIVIAVDAERLRMSGAGEVQLPGRRVKCAVKGSGEQHGACLPENACKLAV